MQGRREQGVTVTAQSGPRGPPKLGFHTRKPHQTLFVMNKAGELLPCFSPGEEGLPVVSVLRGM